MLHAMFSSGMRREQLAKFKLERFYAVIADYENAGVPLHRHLKAMKEWVDWRAEQFPDREFTTMFSNIPGGKTAHKPMAAGQMYTRFKKLIKQ